MREGTASQTARGVAAHRLDYPRIEAPFGDLAADERLTRDVAAGMPARHGRMHDYLRARTAFFDRAVVSALDEGITQIVIGAAGYDGRAFRYARPGVRWFEVDHPATQADKLARLDRLGIRAGHVRFIPADFAVDPIAGPLRAAGLDPALVSLTLLEGVAVYLEQPVLERALREFRAATATGSTLAMSVSVTRPDSASRTRFRARVAALGEPAGLTLTADQATDLLAATGWQRAANSGRAGAAGLLLARAATPTTPTPTSTPTKQPERMRPARAAHPAPSGGESPAEANLPPSDPVPAPLSALLSQALVAFTIEADNEAEHRLPHRTATYGLAPGAPRDAPWLTSLVMWANCLRHLPDEGITIAELLARARTSTNLDGMRRWNYVTYTPDSGRGKRPPADAVIAPTAWGSRARDTWAEVTAVVEARWRDRLGALAFSALREALAGVAARLDPALPDCLPILHYGLYSRRAETPAPAPAPQAILDLPLWALLSKIVLAFALQYEREGVPSLAISANLLRVLTADGVHTKDLPAAGGVSRAAVAIAVHAMGESGLATEGPDPAGGRFKVTRLTPRGVLARAEYQALTAAIEADWRARFGPDRVSALRATLEPLAAGQPSRLYAGLAPYPDNWRARLAAPRTLPHYPMVLHRGGFPDGS